MVHTVETTRTRHGARPGRSCQNVTSRYQLTHDLAAILGLDRGELAAIQLTDDQWSGLVERWGRMSAETRHAHRRQCVRLGHRYTHLPTRSGCGARICLDCLEYRREEADVRTTGSDTC